MDWLIDWLIKWLVGWLVVELKLLFRVCEGRVWDLLSSRGYRRREGTKLKIKFQIRFQIILQMHWWRPMQKLVSPDVLPLVNTHLPSLQNYLQ